MWEKRREEDRQRIMKERKCFKCEGFKHMTYYCRKGKGEGSILIPSNRFKVLKNRVIQRGERSRGEMVKDRREILREEKAKREIEVQQVKVEGKKRKKKMLRKVMVKIGLKQEEEEGIVVEVLLDSKAMELVRSEEFVRKYRFKRTKLERLIYVRNVIGILNYTGPIVDTVEVETFFKGHKERISIDVIGEQK